MQVWKRMGAGLLVLALVLGMMAPQSVSAAKKKKKVKLNKTKVTLTVGKKVKLKLKNNKKKIKWSSSNKKVATVSKKGVVKAKKKGKAKITAKVGKKKYKCTVNVRKKAGGNSASQSANKPKEKVTGTPGKNIAINGDVFSIGTSSTHEYRLALNLTTDQVNTILGTLSTNVKRQEKSPQGFDVIAFRENGNSSDSKADKWGTYILIYLKDGKVVGICAIAKTMSYANVVQSGTKADALSGDSKWSMADWYYTSNGAAGAYATTSSDGTNVLAFVDYYGDKTTYCIQVFSKDYTVDSMTKLRSTQFNCNYSGGVLTAMKTESGELINAYLSYYGISPMTINTKVSSVAQSYSDFLKANSVTDASGWERGGTEIKNALAKAGITSSARGERVLIGNMDAIGFANSIVQSEEARKQICGPTYSVMGLGASNVNDGQYDFPCLVIDYIDFVGTM